MIQNMCIMTFAEKMQQLSFGAKSFFLHKLGLCAQKRKVQDPDAGRMIMEVAHNLHYFFSKPRYTYPMYDENRKTDNIHELIPFVKSINTYLKFSEEEKNKFEEVVLSPSFQPKKSLAIFSKKEQNERY